jgi:oligopeptide transport system substrate-binding protein
VLTDFQPQYRRVYEKNPYYWDAENVHIERVEASYNAEMQTIAPEMFMRGEIDSAPISSEIIDQWLTNPDTAEYVITALPDASYQYFYSFCYAPNPDAVPEVENYLLAIDNEAFRQSLYWGLNRQRAIKGLDPYESGEARLVNTIVAPSWAFDNGVPYTEVGPLAEISARPDWQFDPDKALEYRDQAIEELTAEGATFPVKLLMPYNPVTAGWSQEIEIVTQQLTDLFGPDYIEFIIEAGPSVGFLADVRRTGSYGWMKLNMGGDYHDPQAFTVAFDEQNSWTFLQNCQAPKVRALHDEYLQLLNAAKEIVDDNTARFEAFAAAEAFLLDHALVAPYTSDVSTVGYFVARTNYLESFSNPNDDRYFKGMRVLTEPLKGETFKLLYADWLEAKEASMQ